MDIVFIEQLTVMAMIGVYEWEKQCLQKLIFDLEMGWENRQAARSDDLADCLNYTAVTETVLTLVRGQHFSLVERVAEETAAQLITQFKLSWIRIKVSKPGAVSMAENVGVIIERGRQKI
ncbi:dihydroneopterin aldolase [Sodalis endosymbiont of Henestaris halophilus]|uniref:dihydroneopterin aldolase n=1 Tax=Sodalis endosymbiont of Henestaris halophilus TaxID=1929246 RepID=UPI000BC05556|nr:dihydroneopterin aldolase [Sodalis endosymbiont of Henestaris halophilus]SNC58600.1 Dihydroneopterin aldolase [Sodalis endosymbiont of Henestaris halophilus]